MLPPITLRAFRSARVLNVASLLNRSCVTSSPLLTSSRTQSGSRQDGNSSGNLAKIPVRLHHSSSTSSCTSCCSSSHSTPGGNNNGGIIGSSHSRIVTRRISIYGPLFSEPGKEGSPEPVAVEEDAAGTEDGEDGGKPSRRGPRKPEAPVARHLNKDRSKVIPVETSIRYLNSAAYREAYGDKPVWVPYRRNFPGQFQPKDTRKTCIRRESPETPDKKILAAGNPCPICRDIYLVVDYRNVELLKQFMSPYTGEVLHWDKTGVCRRQQQRLLVEIERAKDYGTITFDVPFREYDYTEYEKIYASY